MKKLVLSIATMFTVAGAMAQGPYLTFSAGYAGAASQEQIGIESVTTATGSIKETPIIGSYGAGIPISLSFGYGFTKHIAFDLGFNYFMGSEITKDITIIEPVVDMTTKVKGYQIRVIPQLVLSTGSDNALNFYSKFGLVIPVAGQTTFTSSGKSQIDFNGTTPVFGSLNVEGESSGAFSLGYTGSFGATFGLSDNLSLFGELQFINLRIKNDSQTLTKYETDGTEQIDLMPVSQKETIYVDEMTEKSNTDPTKPAEVLRSSSNYNSFGFNLGIKYNF